MSYAFDARFSATELELAEIMHRLEPCLHEARVDFDREIMRLSARDGAPTVTSMATQPVTGIPPERWTPGLRHFSRLQALVVTALSQQLARRGVRPRSP